MGGPILYRERQESGEAEMKQPTDTGVHVGCQKMLDLTRKSDQAKGLQRSYVFRLWAFLTLSNFHSYFLTFVQSLTA